MHFSQDDLKKIEDEESKNKYLVENHLNTRKILFIELPEKKRKTIIWLSRINGFVFSFFSGILFGFTITFFLGYCVSITHLSTQTSYESLNVKEVSPEYSFDEVAGLKQIVNKLKFEINLEKYGTEELKQTCKPARRILLYGQPGTGKTHLAYSIAYELDYKLVVLEPGKLKNSLHGATQEAIKNNFDAAADKNVVLLFDEVDSFLKNRESTRGVDTQITNFILDLLEGANSEIYSRLWCVFTTNDISQLDPGFIRRCDYVAHVSQPTATEIEEHLTKKINRMGSTLTTAEIKEVTRRIMEVNPLSMRKVNSVIKRASLKRRRRGNIEDTNFEYEDFIDVYGEV